MAYDYSDIEGLLGLSEKEKASAANMGLLQAGLGILANNTNKVNPLQALAMGAQQGLQGYSGETARLENMKLKQIDKRMLIEKLKKQQDMEKAKQEFLANPSIPAQIKQGVAAGIIDMSDLAKPVNVPENAKVVSPLMSMMGMNGELATGAPKAPKTTIEPVAQRGGLWQDFYASDGKVDENSPVGVPYAKRATASTSDTSVTLPKIDLKLGESVAGQVGPMLKESKMQAAGAVNMFDSADRLEKALASNKVLTGPLSSASLTVRQFLDPKGKSPEILETRKAVRALAESTVNARKALQGQGQITEQEGMVAAKAESGDIDSMTAGELKILVNLNKRAAKLRAQEHQSMLAEAEKEPSTKKLTGFYRVGGIDPILNWTDPTAAKSIRQQADAIVGR